MFFLQILFLASFHVLQSSFYHFGILKSDFSSTQESQKCLSVFYDFLVLSKSLVLENERMLEIKFVKKKLTDTRKWGIISPPLREKKKLLFSRSGAIIPFFRFLFLLLNLVTLSFRETKSLKIVTFLTKGGQLLGGNFYPFRVLNP